MRVSFHFADFLGAEIAGEVRIDGAGNVTLPAGGCAAPSLGRVTPHPHIGFCWLARTPGGRERRARTLQRAAALLLRAHRRGRDKRREHD
ncbi:MAG: hypothetical protein OXG90_12855 [Gammaproteobacteria bacterium]|nr:hypothetical protein [Gammaproteobacteria bacterium]MYA36657.1 hypothetical protein [Gammaproteobacteria bacterium]